MAGFKADEYPLYNVKSRERELLDDSLVNDAILGGTHSFPAGSKVPVFDPDGRKATIGAEELRSALKEGFKVLGPKELAVDEYLSDNDNMSGAAKVFFGQAMDEFALGVPELIADYTDDPFQAAKREALKKQHETWNLLGGITGFTGSALLGPARLGTVGAKAITESAKRAVAARLVRGEAVAGAESAAGGLLSRLGNKTLEGASEGAVLSMPHAITESAFGDHDAAAESMLYGTIGGGIFGGGVGLSGEMLDAARKGSGRFYSWAEGRPLTGQEVAKKAARIVTGVPEEHIAHLADEENLARMIRRNPEGGGYEVIVPTKESIRDEAESVLNTIIDNHDQAQRSYTSILEDVNSSFRRELDDIQRQSAPEPVIAKVDDFLTQMKEQSGDIRIQYDNTLQSIHDSIMQAADPQTIRKMPFYIPKQTITKMFNALEENLGAESAVLGKQAGLTASPGKMAASKRLQGLRAVADDYFTRVEEQYGRDMPGMDMLFARNIVRDLDDIANYGLGSGEFDSAVSNTVKGAQKELRDSIRKKLSDLQKRPLTPFVDEMTQDTVKQLAKQAEVLWDTQIRKAGVLSEASQYFKNPIRTANALDAMTGKNFRASEIARVLRQVEEETGEQVLPMLDDWIARKDLLKESKMGPKQKELVRSILLPEQDAALQRARQRAEAAEAELKPLKGFNGRRIESIVNRVDYKNASIDDTRKLELLSELRDRYMRTPENPGFISRNFAKEAKDRAIWDSFDQARLNGSRKAVMGGSLGAAIFSIFGPQAASLGAAIGAGGGGAIDYYGGKMLRDFIINGNNYRSLLFVERQMKNAAKKLDSITTAVDSFSNRSALAPARTVRLGGIQAILNLKGDFTSRREHWEEIQDKVSELASNPDLMMSRVSDMSKFLSENGAPSIGGRYNQKLMKSIQYIFDEMPKPPRGPSPFAPKVKWKPSDYDLKMFDDKLEVIADPFVVIDRMKDRSISKGHVHALKANYPRIYDEIKWKTSETLMQKGVSVPRGDRIKLSLLFDSEFDAGLSDKGMLSSQALYASAGASVSAGGAAAGQKLDVNIAGQYSTPEGEREARV